MKPVGIPSTEGQVAISIACGMFHTVVLTSAGTVLAFGDANNGELGQLYQGIQPKPVYMLLYTDSQSPTLRPTRFPTFNCGALKKTVCLDSDFCSWQVIRRKGKCVSNSGRRLRQ